jgi:molybdopterin-guanine dinucleotide biosynthesis protein A
MSETGNPETCARLPISVIVLAGGRGERLGQDKATLELGGATLLQRVLGTLAPLSDDLIVVLRHDQELAVPNARIVCDLEPFAGVLAGMAGGLTAARHAWSFVVACDMPFVDPALVRYMFSQRSGYDIVVPRTPAGLEPLHALYHRRCLHPLRRALLNGERRVISFYASLRGRYIEATESKILDPRELSFFNINTPEDMDRARSWLGDS